MKQKKDTSLTGYSEMSEENSDYIMQMRINELSNQERIRRFKHTPINNGKKFRKNGVTYEILGHYWDWFDVQGERKHLDSIRFTDGVTIFAMELQEFYNKVQI